LTQFDLIKLPSFHVAVHVFDHGFWQSEQLEIVCQGQLPLGAVLAGEADLCLAGPGHGAVEPVKIINPQLPRTSDDAGIPQREEMDLNGGLRILPNCDIRI
jgi:hypothetical protein